ncbi:MAG: MBL fold metallo-hydrolase [Phycisphaerales bacterium]|nr:MAG: MBL fold metallo-hydrolase [Phycisphaerales bacterium]
MNSVHSCRSRVLLCGFVLGLVLLTVGRVNADFAFGLAENLGPAVNSEHEDSVPSISTDGRSLYFGSNRPGGLGADDLWVSTRVNVSDAWSEPVNLGPLINSSSIDCQPGISPDELSLYFRSNRSGSRSSRDLWVTRRTSKAEPWGAPVRLGSELDGGPGVSSDALSLYLAADWPGGIGAGDIWMATRSSVLAPWGEPVNLGPVINSPSDDGHPDISAQGLALFFFSRRPGGYGGRDLWVTTRAAEAADWREPVNLGLTINTAYHDGCPSLSADEQVLYFDSVRPGGFGGHDIWQAPIHPLVDLDGDGTVNLKDFATLAQSWRRNESSVDIGLSPLGDGVVDFRDLAVLVAHWLADTSPPIYIQWLGHASVKIWTDDVVVYVDPRNLGISPHDATVVLVTHTHGDHFAPSDIARVSTEETVFVAPPDVVASYGSGQALAPDETLELVGATITGIRAYNTNKPNHPRANNWLGYVIEIAGRRIYCAGDTDVIEEMKTLEAIDVAFLPAGGTYTATAREAAEATAYFRPRLAVPYHWGDIIGTQRDAEEFARFAACEVKIMARGEILGSTEWGTEFSLFAHWALDEEAGVLVADSAGSADGVLSGTPYWLPAEGAVGGALRLDGPGNYVTVPAVLNPSDGPFSIFAWVKGDLPGAVILSQVGGANWLGADALSGYLGTELVGNGRRTGPLWSEAAITDGDWHHIGLVWNGAERVLYVDALEVARDAQGNLSGSAGDWAIGAGAALEPGTFWSGLIDDVRVYRRAITIP